MKVGWINPPPFEDDPVRALTYFPASPSHFPPLIFPASASPSHLPPLIFPAFASPSHLPLHPLVQALAYHRLREDKTEPNAARVC